MNSEDRDYLIKAVLIASQAIERDGALRSSLRRAETALDAVGLEAVDRFHRTVEKLSELRNRSQEIEGAVEGAVILIAHRNVLAYAEANRHSIGGSNVLARRFGEGERKPLSPLRFQKLLRAGDTNERLRLTRRALSLLGAPVHPVSVVEGFFDLHHDRGRRRFARAYFTGVGDAAPAKSLLVASI